MARNPQFEAKIRRDTDGRFANKPASRPAPVACQSIPTPHAINLASRHILTDPDTTEYEPWARHLLDQTLDGATITRGSNPDDKPLIKARLQYDPSPDAPAGSSADYIKEALDEAWDGYEIHIPDHDRLTQETRNAIIQTSLNPNQTLTQLNLPPMNEQENTLRHQQDTQREQTKRQRWFDTDEARRWQAANKAADTRRNRTNQALTRHLTPLNPTMRNIYTQNVDKGLINGSANEDRMAFADALAELQRSGWDPEQGVAYRSSPDFKRLERRLLAGRRPTRRYRQMRDALCDDEGEYRAFMAADPDVFDPDEKVSKPFAGLGPDVGQWAMLRLAARHRGVGDAIRLARRDPGIMYTVGDAKSHTFTVTCDRDEGEDRLTHHAVTANGIKPATVMPWVMGEAPGSPEWEERSRTRFEDANGGHWASRHNLA